jgi:hypothetical protein
MTGDELAGIDPSERRWELNRLDSRRLAYIKGTLIGLAAGYVVSGAIALCLEYAWTDSILSVIGGGRGEPWLIYLIRFATVIVQPLGILVGGSTAEKLTRRASRRLE